ncbi:MAG TPA: ribonuclease III [Oculatellaceae cyanobacterium]|jgi:ribonuclease-3
MSIVTDPGQTIDAERKKQILQLLKTLGVKRPKNYTLYDRALTHSSYAYENKLSSVDNYERLEYLGDAVLKLVVSEYLFNRFPDYREGDLTKIRAVVVSDARLADLAREIQLGDYIIFGASEAKSGGRNKNSNLACAFEALLGAMHLDGKQDEVRNFLHARLESLVTEIDMSKTKDNYKAVLQELTQADGGMLPSYRTVRESGPSHNRTFFVEVYINGEMMGCGSGKSKKEAQQAAARQALEVLNALDETST